MDFEDFLRYHNINLNVSHLPSYIKGFAYFNGCAYLVMINNRCSNVQQKETIVHELIHIFENHFSCKSGYEEQCEKEVDQIIKKLKFSYNGL